MRSSNTNGDCQPSESDDSDAHTRLGRRGLSPISAPVFRVSPIHFTAVSYTHLDVYKRQARHSTTLTTGIQNTVRRHSRTWQPGWSMFEANHNTTLTSLRSEVSQITVYAPIKLHLLRIAVTNLQYLMTSC